MATQGQRVQSATPDTGVALVSRTRRTWVALAGTVAVASLIAGVLLVLGRSPVRSVVGLDSQVLSIVAGSGHTCALTVDREVKCWGENHFGQLGDQTTERSARPVLVSGLGEEVTTIAAGGGQSCAITVGARLTCWGGYDIGGVGGIITKMSATPTDVPGLEGGVKAVALGGRGEACAITLGGAVRCWGGELGTEPAEIGGLGSPAVSIAVGGFHACAVLEDGGVACWGGNNVGQTGGRYTPWQTKNPNAPVSRVRGVENAVQVAAGHLFTVALIGDGSVLYWGQVTSADREANLDETSGARPVRGLGPSAHAVAAAGMHACAITDDGVECWGANNNGELGDPHYWGDDPVRVGMKDSVSVAAGDLHSCAVTRTGAAKCWGYNGVGQLGTGDFD